MTADDYALANIFTPQIISRLKNLKNKTPAQLTRLCVLTCGEGTDLLVGALDAANRQFTKGRRNETLRPTGAFLKARPGNRVWFTATCGVLVLSEQVQAPEIIYTARLFHNPKAKVALPTNIWGDVPQFECATS